MSVHTLPIALRTSWLLVATATIALLFLSAAVLQAKAGDGPRHDGALSLLPEPATVTRGDEAAGTTSIIAAITQPHPPHGLSIAIVPGVAALVDAASK